MMKADGRIGAEITRITIIDENKIIKDGEHTISMGLKIRSRIRIHNSVRDPLNVIRVKEMLLYHTHRYFPIDMDIKATAQLKNKTVIITAPMPEDPLPNPEEFIKKLKTEIIPTALHLREQCRHIDQIKDPVLWGKTMVWYSSIATQAIRVYYYPKVTKIMQEALDEMPNSKELFFTLNTLTTPSYNVLLFEKDTILEEGKHLVYKLANKDKTVLQKAKDLHNTKYYKKALERAKQKKEKALARIEQELGKEKAEELWELSEIANILQEIVEERDDYGELNSAKLGPYIDTLPDIPWERLERGDAVYIYPDGDTYKITPKTDITIKKRIIYSKDGNISKRTKLQLKRTALTYAQLFYPLGTTKQILIYKEGNRILYTVDMGTLPLEGHTTPEVINIMKTKILPEALSLREECRKIKKITDPVSQGRIYVLYSAVIVNAIHSHYYRTIVNHIKQIITPLPDYKKLLFDLTTATTPSYNVKLLTKDDITEEKRHMIYYMAKKDKDLLLRIKEHHDDEFYEKILEKARERKKVAIQKIEQELCKEKAELVKELAEIADILQEIVEERDDYMELHEYEIEEYYNTLPEIPWERLEQGETIKVVPTKDSYEVVEE